MTATPASPAESAQANPPRFLRRMFWNVVLIAHGTLAMMWWWRQPAGFAATDRHFWVNTILPWVVLAAAIAGRFPRGRWGPAVRPYILSTIPIIWIASAISGRVIFPITFEFLFIAPLLAGLLLAAIWLSEHWRLVRRPLDVVTIFAAAIGAGLTMSQRGAAPGTIPLNALIPDMPSDTETASFPQGVQLSADARVYIAEGSINYQSGEYMVAINPILTFTSRSPDGCWVLFALPHERQGPPRALRAVQHEGSQLRLLFGEDDLSMLQVAAFVSTRSVEAEAFTRFARPIWSHLNTFTELSLSGHKRLFVEFSPCPGERIEVVPMDYPAGRPERFAYLAADWMFHVVEARTAEKGPFRELASGRLSRGEPIAITFHDEQKPIYRLTLDDFSSQASTNPSPTAGWGIPENAIEFRLEGDEPTSPAAVFVTLASTSVGSGYDSVGHMGGTYRNRLKLEPLTSPATAPTNTNQ